MDRLPDDDRKGGIPFKFHVEISIARIPIREHSKLWANERTRSRMLYLWSLPVNVHAYSNLKWWIITRYCNEVPRYDRFKSFIRSTNNILYLSIQTQRRNTLYLRSVYACILYYLKNSFTLLRGFELIADISARILKGIYEVAKTVIKTVSKFFVIQVYKWWTRIVISHCSMCNASAFTINASVYC